MMNNNIPMNPIQVIGALKAGGDPNHMMRHLIRQHPVVRQAAQLMNGKTPEQVRDMAYQMAAQRGVDLNQLARQLGVQLPK